MIAAHSPRTATTIPTLPARSILGHLHAYRRDRLALLLEVGRRCGDVGAFRVGPRLLSAYHIAEGVTVWIITEAADEDGYRPATALFLLKSISYVEGSRPAPLPTSESENHHADKAMADKAMAEAVDRPTRAPNRVSQH